MRTLLRNLLIVAVVIGAIVALSNLLRDGNERQGLDERIAVLRAAGEPTTMAELAGDPVPPDQNAATLLAEADRLSTDDAGYFDLIRRASRRPVWRVDAEWQKGPSAVNAEARWLEQAAAYLKAQVRKDDELERRTERAAEAMLIHLSLAEIYGGPLIPGYHVNLKHRNNSLDILRVALARPDFDARRFRELVDGRLATTLPPTGPPARPIIQHRVVVLWAVRTWEQGDLTHRYGRREDRRRSTWMGRHRIYTDAELALDLADRAIAACGVTPERAARVPDGFEQQLGRARRTLFRDVQGSVRRLFRRYVKTVARMRLARVVLAVLEHRQVEGAWPDALADDLPKDPSTGAPFLYERDGDGVRLSCAYAKTYWRLAPKR